jgi:hypothetical protein
MARSSRWKSVQERIERRRKPTAVKPKKMYSRPQSTPETAARMRGREGGEAVGEHQGAGGLIFQDRRNGRFAWRSACSSRHFRSINV